MNELEKIDKYIYSSLVELLFDMVPEYKNEVQQLHLQVVLPDDGVYMYMHEFTECLVKKIIKDISSEFVINAFSYINKVGESHNLELQNIIRVGILEILYTTKELDRNKVRNMLNQKLKTDFDNFSNHYN